MISSSSNSAFLLTGVLLATFVVLLGVSFTGVVFSCFVGVRPFFGFVTDSVISDASVFVFLLGGSLTGLGFSCFVGVCPFLGLFQRGAALSGVSGTSSAAAAACASLLARVGLASFFGDYHNKKSVQNKICNVYDEYTVLSFQMPDKSWKLSEIIIKTGCMCILETPNLSTCLCVIEGCMK